MRAVGWGPQRRATGLQLDRLPTPSMLRDQSWYSDGVRVVDVSDPTDPEELAYFVPPAGQNPVKPPQRGTLSQMPQIWGVVVDDATGLIYASDMNSGLWILERTD